MKLMPTVTRSTASRRAASKRSTTMPAGHKAVVVAHSPWSVETDPGLMPRIAAGNKAAFTELARRHMPGMLGFARRYVQASEAEDIVQEALTRIWLKAGQWQDRGASPRSWLLRIVYNLCMDSLRKQPMQGEQASDELATTANGPAQDFEQGREQQQLQQAMQALPERQRSAIMLTVYHALSNREAADILGVSVDALESLLRRGRRGLKKVLGQQRGES
jgi:RNA polymerase sigma-70 factor (ECF subfamily)